MGRVGIAGTVALALLAGCLRADLVDCGNGLICPSALVCDLAHATCVTPDQIGSCAGMPELAPCLGDGVCREGTCLPIGCGNARVDPAEACDDGNTSSGDGCSADCLSTERCGNGVVDFVDREQCDDGNLIQHDGCDSRCQPEAPRWTLLEQVGHPERQQFGYAYDTARQRLVVFGGADSANVRLDDTFEWDGVAQLWRRRHPVMSPTPRLGLAMTYDAARHVSVLFGGSDFGGSLDDTWLWDGEHWSSASSAAAPPARVYSQMTYDARRKRVVLFGGRGVGGVLLDDTWAWDGTSWTQLHPAHAPSARERGALAYDPVRDQILLAGGFTTSTQSDAWIFDGLDWQMVAPVGTTRLSAALAWDPVRRGIVLVGGSASSPCMLWDGTAWSALPAIVPARFYAAAYYDDRAGAVIGGLGFPLGTPLVADMQRLDASWTPLAADPGPTPRTASMITYDARRGRLVMFGGNAASFDRDETFELDHGGWITRSPATRPPTRDRGAMSYDKAHGRSVLWGGTTDPLVWEWDGTAWTSKSSTAPAPTERSTHAMAFDADGALIVFGGLDLNGVRDADTWAWDGASWQDLTSGTGPLARSSHAMVLDEARGELVMFGGSDGVIRYGDTWTWTRAGGWVERFPATSPPGRSRHGMTYDPIRKQVVIFGGVIGGTILDDSWAWDGTTWTRVFAELRPPAQQEDVLGFDPLAGEVIAMGSAGTWSLQWRGPTSDDACATASDRDADGVAGCAEPDCSAACAPLCPIATSCAIGPHCGDGVCDPTETCRLCAADCGACSTLCGDGACDPGETCPGDCGP